MSQSSPSQSTRDTGKYCLAFAFAALLGYFLVRAEFLALLGSLLIALVLSCLWLARLCIKGLRTDIEVAGNPVLADTPVKTRLRLRNRNRLLPILAPTILIRESGRGKAQYFHYAGLIKAGETIERAIYPTFRRRGLQRLTAVEAFSRFPLGMAQTRLPLSEPLPEESRSRTAAGHSPEVVVWPRRDGAAPEAPSAGNYSEGGFSFGQKPRSNSPIDAFRIRDYQQGDSKRSISWKLSAKLDKLMVLQPDRSPEPQHVIVLDTLAALWMPVAQFERMIALVAGLVSQLATQNRLSAVILNGSRFPLKTAKGYAAFMDALSLCAPVEGPAPSQANQQLRHGLQVLPDGRGGILLQPIASNPSLAASHDA